jgi:hypothetical protein
MTQANGIQMSMNRTGVVNESVLQDARTWLSSNYKPEELVRSSILRTQRDGAVVDEVP